MFASGAARRSSGTAARLFAVVALAAALVVAPTTWHAPTAVAATPTAITDAPTTATVGTPYTFSGTVTDESPVAAVEVSTDAGVTWRAAGWQAGLTTWDHTFTPSGSGAAQLRVRALDAAGGTVGEASAETSVAARVCPCGLWSGSDVPSTVDAADDAAVELGVKWRSTHDGHVRGIRFYKGPRNTGTHTGSLWSAAGVRLATGTFRDETASGWQTLVFPTPVPVDGDTTYVTSYFAPAGHYSFDHGYFAHSSRFLEPLTGLQTGVDGPNGVFRAGAGFPGTASADTNYWVDVVWAPEPGADTRAPDLTGTTPVAGAGSVPLSDVVTAAFDEPVAPGSAEFTLTGPGGPVAGDVSTSGNGMTAQFQPHAPLPAGTPFTASARVRDAAGNQTAAHTWQFTTGSPRAAECPCTLWDDFTTPPVPATDDAQAVELGVKVRFAGKGEVLGVRFYKGPGNTGTHTGSFWTSTGILLATGTFSGETTTGWQELTFAAPVPVQANTTYVVSYYAPHGHYAATLRHFESQPTTYGPITAPGDGANGTYRYGGGFPTGGHLASNYWVDVVYRNGLNGDTTRPTLDTRAPGPDATDVPLDQPFTLGFSEPVDPESATVVLTDPAGAELHGTSTYSADRETVTWTPNGALKAGTRYAASVQAADVNGNTMASAATWTITTRATAPCPCSLFSTATVPRTPSANDGGAYELGTRFATTRGGWVTGVRFYKGEGNTGVHTGSLWTAGGQRIATGTFADETATGWQTLVFAEPVPIASNTTYVASYTAPDGHYAVDQQYFTRRHPVVSAPLTTAEGSTAGVFVPGGGFPNRSWDGNNYWVDVDFTPFTDTTPPVHIGHTPTDNGTDVALDASLTATYDEQVSLVGTTFRVVDSHGVPMRGAVTRADGNRTLVWTPAAPLVRGTAYTATVRAVDVYENVAAETVTWSYTTGNPPCPCSLFSEAAVPEVLEGSYFGGAGIGVKFVPTVDGFVTGVKYYKSPANGGEHTAHLSLPDNTTLATGGFTGETTSGWQRMTFAEPVPVTAGTTYLAWYTTWQGRQSETRNYFASGGVTTPRLTAPGGPGSPNGMFGRIQGFPDFPRNADNHNYWVDVVFTTA
ncbi:hypothetical protein ADK67_39675 [Saccharothrix sp. NRRL B-16348]|uniref:DUF4082 domain-containing protein n=1 Tax=Saccharothrix sp. NRRL B-16348 TaxID=1415542 RepID=UPI0006ADCDE8|nr:DUF4082 domain-containing protein [Saccharothrix sp. NRRL B-16348]KOX16827.1 hypothetical protein ADK67_39675 [Saccharothrix sp. NRRL B-16348]